ncbi:amino acid ABC transporter permease [Helicobacter ailurogastricus]|uniref:Polar amino acid ABC uptake transporter membrane-spanning protein n=1 Tax=Helicobacter ailurogastricus TaxID=1578720 RepID=A0A0K2Y2G9_9HELI|nr:amino acid ABC transporter permease [Helicobacter ailurogastricus]GLH57306.1 Glutamine ABC transporter, permease protein GlnP [Helicobacter ailurogastricus]GLH59547.1 Glutamine ABC transporter, permease protein GlnP [Helicobacter ailurogastricus]GMB91915.1 Glutamine ABC transporter, permease protein GlnP [Helicobacter ailurogastricus]CRI32165.1 Polar amino acid ABC uptake transporter membrane-spanning protein [Helicobacter ailurogastricus]
MDLDWQFMRHALPLFGRGLALTLEISFFGILGATLLGFGVALCLFFKPKVLCGLAKGYTELARNTPLLIQLFFLYYGLHEVGFSFSALVCAVLGVVFLGGAYMAESFLLGFKALNRVQLESSLSLGLSKWQSLLFVLLPQSLAISLPSLGANVIFLLKETSVVSAIALADLMFVAKDLIGIYYKTNEALVLLVLSYLVVLLPLSGLFVFLEKHYKKKTC